LPWLARKLQRLLQLRGIQAQVNMTLFNELLREIVPAVREGIEFYEFAGRRVEPVYLKSTFASMAMVKSDFACALQAELLDQPTRKNGTVHLSGIARRIYASGIYATARTAFQPSPPAECLEALIDQEEWILEALYDALDEARFDECGPRIIDILRLHLLRLHSSLDAMRRARLRMTIGN
jgi:hypothetical protein